MDTSDCEECGNYINSDEHKAVCLEDEEAAKRLAYEEGFWDSHGVSGYEL